MLGSSTSINPWDKDPMGASNNSTNAASLPSFDNSGFNQPKGFGNFSAPNQGFQQQRENPGQNYPQNNYAQEKNSRIDSKDIELISSKLDTIKSMLESLNHRVDNIEKEIIAKNEETPKTPNNRRPYW